MQTSSETNQRQISIAASRDGSTRNGSPTFSPNGKADTLPDEPGTPTRASSLPVPLSSPNAATTDVESRRDELLGLLAAFPITLQHHMMGTRALPHSPACDLLPLGYLTSLKRTEARVRFASAHAGPSGSGSPKPKVESSETNGTKSGSEEDSDTISATPAKKSNLQIPYPTNLPLSCLRLMEAYIVGLGSLPAERGGWTQLQVERAHAITKGLSANLSQAEDLSDGMLILRLSTYARTRTNARDDMVSQHFCWISVTVAWYSATDLGSGPSRSVCGYTARIRRQRLDIRSRPCL